MNNFYGWDIDPQASNNYISACKSIFENEEEFSNFKSNQQYQVILEHVDPNLGHKYLEHILRVGEDIFEDYYSKFSENDTIGNPALISYGSKNISPTTLRYIKNTLDLTSLCSDTEVKRIVEVGGGYGGLCKTISVLCDFDEYILVDLPEVVKVQEKYLSNFPEIFSKLKFVPCSELEDVLDVDLFISNYALSELNIDTQMDYYEKIIKNSKILYITYNAIIDSNSNYNIFTDKLKDTGFKMESGYIDYGYHNNLIIAAKR